MNLFLRLIPVMRLLTLLLGHADCPEYRPIGRPESPSNFNALQENDFGRPSRPIPESSLISISVNIVETVFR
jgi:hypothetical protein